MTKQKEGKLLDRREIVLDRALLAKMKANGAEADQLRGAVANAKLVRVFAITYQSNGHRVKGFLAMPRKLSKKMPCVIWNRGGLGPNFAIKDLTVFRPIAALASWGYVVVASQYSGCAGSEGTDDCGGPKTVNDVLNLRTVLSQVPNADLKRIGMHGGSRGGMMTYLCLAKVKWIKAAVTVAGLADVARNFRGRPDLKTYSRQFWNPTRQNMQLRSAVCWPEKFYKKTPLLLMHGTSDWRVSPQDSIDLATALYKHRVPYRLVVFEGDDHGITEHADERSRLTREWFDRFVKDGKPLPNLKPHGT